MWNELLSLLVYTQSRCLLFSPMCRMPVGLPGVLTPKCKPILAKSSQNEARCCTVNCRWNDSSSPWNVPDLEGMRTVGLYSHISWVPKWCLCRPDHRNTLNLMNPKNRRDDSCFHYAGHQSTATGHPSKYCWDWAVHMHMSIKKCVDMCLFLTDVMLPDFPVWRRESLFTPLTGIQNFTCCQWLLFVNLSKWVISVSV